MSGGGIVGILSAAGVIGSTPWFNAITIAFTCANALIALFSSPFFSSASRQPINKDTVGLIALTNNSRGGICIYANRALKGETIYLSSGFSIHNRRPKAVKQITKYQDGTRMIYGCAFSLVEPGHYLVSVDSLEFTAKAIVSSGQVEIVDWTSRKSNKNSHVSTN
jgi:hypothetical protein